MKRAKPPTKGDAKRRLVGVELHTEINRTRELQLLAIARLSLLDTRGAPDRHLIKSVAALLTIGCPRKT